MTIDTTKYVEALRATTNGHGVSVDAAHAMIVLAVREYEARNTVPAGWRQVVEQHDELLAWLADHNYPILEGGAVQTVKALLTAAEKALSQYTDELESLQVDTEVEVRGLKSEIATLRASITEQDATIQAQRAEIHRLTSLVQERDEIIIRHRPYSGSSGVEALDGRAVSFYVISPLSVNGTLTMRTFDEIRPDFMPSASAVQKMFGLQWGEIVSNAVRTAVKA